MVLHIVYLSRLYFYKVGESTQLYPVDTTPHINSDRNSDMSGLLTQVTIYTCFSSVRGMHLKWPVTHNNLQNCTSTQRIHLFLPIDESQHTKIIDSNSDMSGLRTIVYQSINESIGMECTYNCTLGDQVYAILLSIVNSLISAKLIGKSKLIININYRNSDMSGVLTTD